MNIVPTTLSATTLAVKPTTTTTTAMPNLPSDGMPTWAIVLIVLGSVSAAAAAVFTAYSVKYGFPWKKRTNANIARV